MKNQGNMSPRETHKSPRTDPEEMDICELSGKEFRVILFIKIFYFTNLRKNIWPHTQHVGT